MGFVVRSSSLSRLGGREERLLHLPEFPRRFASLSNPCKGRRCPTPRLWNSLPLEAMLGPSWLSSGGLSFNDWFDQMAQRKLLRL